MWCPADRAGDVVPLSRRATRSGDAPVERPRGGIEPPAVAALNQPRVCECLDQFVIAVWAAASPLSLLAQAALGNRSRSLVLESTV